MSNLSLYQIGDEYLIDLALLKSMEIDDQTFDDTLEGLPGEFENKSIAVVMYAQNLMASANAIDDAIMRMMDRSKAIKKKSDRMKQFVLENMQRTDIKKIESPYFVISVRNNPESVVVDADISIPEKFLIWPDMPAPTVDKKKIKAAIQSGETIAGVHLERKQSLQIK
jgi:Siphovirus Gp157